MARPVARLLYLVYLLQGNLAVSACSHARSRGELLGNGTAAGDGQVSNNRLVCGCLFCDICDTEV